MSVESELLDLLCSARAMRRLKPDPIPDELLDQVLRAAVSAPNGGNRQNWRFLVIKDAAVKQRVQYYYKKALDEVIAPQYRTSDPPTGVTREQYDRQLEAVIYLTEHFHEAPVWIVACLDEGNSIPSRWSGASIYPAVQNILVASRALGLGATLTTRHMFYESEVEEILGLPSSVHSYAIIPMGYPIGRFGPVRRKPVSDVVYLDRWGNKWNG